MYDLKSDKVNNIKIKEMIANPKNQDSVNKIRQTGSIEKVSYIIFNEDIDKRMFILASATLTLGDELKLPIEKNMADLLFFTLCANANSDVNMHIKNISQANILFKLYENYYTAINIQSNKSNVRFTELKSNFNYFFPGYTVEFKIPVAFFRAKGKNYVTLSGLTYCEFIVNHQTYKIPRVMYLKFFKDSLVKGRLICESTDDLKSKFDINNREVLEDILQYIGYSRKTNLQKITLPVGTTFVDDGKIFSVAQFENDLNIYWTKIKESEYILLPKLDYVPIRNTDPGLVDLLT
jgi:hypothetical protein